MDIKDIWKILVGMLGDRNIEIEPTTTYGELGMSDDGWSIFVHGPVKNEFGVYFDDPTSIKTVGQLAQAISYWDAHQHLASLTKHPKVSTYSVPIFLTKAHRPSPARKKRGATAASKKEKKAR